MTINEWMDLCEKDPAKANALCAEAMGWIVEPTWRGCRWRNESGVVVRGDEKPWSPIADRNDAAMMAQHIVDYGAFAILRFNKFLNDADPHWPQSPLDAITLSPAIIAWACVKALCINPLKDTDDELFDAIVKHEDVVVKKPIMLGQIKSWKMSVENQGQPKNVYEWYACTWWRQNDLYFTSCGNKTTSVPNSVGCKCPYCKQLIQVKE